VLRRGETIDQAAPRVLSSLKADNDRALARAIAAEVLRHLPDLDALIDSATQRPLPHDAKARFALRIALAQALRLGTPGHAAISTVLPLVDGGPRKLVHGVFGTLDRRPCPNRRLCPTRSPRAGKRPGATTWCRPRDARSPSRHPST
jgi:16S rRNA (cytosine967-C5)-methyltransferase